jgi:pimeloyl-ACP methyl ester carboxylesterase
MILMNHQNNKIFKSPEGKEQFLTYYNQILSHLSGESIYIDTKYGKTFVFASGQPDHPPMVLLHGSCSNSAFWAAEISRFSGKYRVYAIDLIGEAGNSEEKRYDLNDSSYSLWLKEVFDQLMIPSPVIIGNSFGGWMALKFTTAFPEYVDKLVLISPSGLSPIKTEFLSKSSEYVSQNSDKLESFDDSIIGDSDIPDKAKEFIMMILRNFNPMTEPLPAFSEKEIKKLCMPVLLITGEQDVTIDVHEAAARLTALTPNSEVHMLSGYGHIIGDAGNIIAPFLEKENKI